MREKRTEDRLRSLGVAFVRVGYADLTRGRAALAQQVRRSLGRRGPVTRDFDEVPRPHGRPRLDVRDEDGWLARTDDRVGGSEERPGAGSTRPAQC